MVEKKSGGMKALLGQARRMDTRLIMPGR